MRLGVGSPSLSQPLATHKQHLHLSPTKHFITQQCLAVAKVERCVRDRFTSKRSVTDLILRVSERVEQSVTARSSATTSRVSRSPPSAVSLVEVVSSVSQA